MSSEVLLEEIIATVKPVVEKKNFLSSSKSKDKIEGLLVTEQVRLASLRRQQELVSKLASELPARIAQMETEAGQLARESEELKRAETERAKRISDLKLARDRLEIEFKRIAAQLKQKRENEAVAVFQKEKIYETISRVVEVRKSLAGRFVKAVGSKQDDDARYLSLRIEQNDALLKEIDERLSEIVDAHF